MYKIIFLYTVWREVVKWLTQESLQTIFKFSSSLSVFCAVLLLDAEDFRFRPLMVIFRLEADPTVIERFHLFAFFAPGWKRFTS